MKVNVRDEWLEEIERLLRDGDGSRTGCGAISYGYGRKRAKLDMAELSDVALEKLEDYLEQHANSGDRSAKLSLKTVREWIAVKANPDQNQTVSRLENLEPVLKQVIGQTDHGYLFQATPDGNLLPWFVSEIEFVEARCALSQAIVKMRLTALNAKSMGMITFAADDIRDRTLREVLAAKSLYLETPKQMECYERELKKYREYCDQIGMQMTATGKAQLVDGWYHAGYRGVGKAGVPAKMVIDTEATEADEEDLDGESDELEPGVRSVHAPYWSDDEDVLWAVPVHPLLHMFDLEEHAFYRVHVNQVEPYTYDTTVDRNLVLPAEQKDFIRLLIDHSKATFQDIVRGKEGGTIVMLEGPPGVGKTLTAEVYAEVMERPLYRVHSSQIGIDPETIEGQLKEVLASAERWGAILLIDEGDVFLRSRGDDMVQNAVVGVFLRLLEYYRGVLFTTTNRGTDIDDAIVSRLTARFEYAMPSADEQRELWRILGAQNGIEIPPKRISEIIKRLPGLSGRDIKNLLKLAMVAGGDDGITPELLERVSRFRQNRAAA